MKKAKRFLTGLLSAALALSLCAMPAMADEGEGNAQTPEIKTSVSTIDKTKKGSITIYKYLHSTALSAHPPQRKAEPDHSNHPAGRG